MIVINEWLANPAGPDTTGEWIELFNTEPSMVSLAGWKIQNKAGKEYALNQTIPGNGYVVLSRGVTKLALRNSGEELTLFDPSGRIISQSYFPGSMPEGKSVGLTAGHYLLMQPSPGRENFAGALVYPRLEYPLGQPLNAGPGFWSVIGLALGMGILITGAVAFLRLNTYEDKDLVR